MKYVMMEVTICEGDAAGTRIHVPFIFPEAQVHADVAKSVHRMLAMQYRRSLVKAVSAGKYDLYTQQCSGESETLRLKSRFEDSRTIQTYAYCHGIQSND